MTNNNEIVPRTAQELIDFLKTLDPSTPLFMRVDSPRSGAGTNEVTWAVEEGELVIKGWASSDNERAWCGDD